MINPINDYSAPPEPLAQASWI